ncbi:MAG: VanW family protein [Lachnospiraceae bacterium]|nr:VanW family protein [Lachnospiraceae bacterium]
MANTTRKPNGTTNKKTNTAGRPTVRSSTAGRTTVRKPADGRRSSKAGSRKRKKLFYRRIRIGVIALVLVAVVAFLVAQIPGRIRTASKTDNILIYVDGENFTNMTQKQAQEYLEKKYAWNMSVVYGEQSMPIENPFIEAIEKVVTRAYNEAEWEQKRLDSRSFWDKLFPTKEDEQILIQHDLGLPDLSEIAANLASEVAVQWRVPAQNSLITGYDAASDMFLFSQATDGWEINEEKLKEDILQAYENKDYQAVLTVEASQVAPEITKDAYRVMGAYTTTTTNNQDRNTNVGLAAEAVNGQIVQPGEQFSYNTVVGERTEAKGYKPAAAYANGETVQEYGGGVCQVSSTLYNAVIAAGLQTNERTGHSYEPTYVTPGQDATVSYMKPDFVFTNTSEVPIGIRTSFLNRTMYVEIFGVPVLEEGTKRYMESQEVSLVDPPAPTYVEDPAVPYGQEVVTKNPTNGSIWTTDIVLEKDGEIIERTYLHRTSYKGHAAVIHRNTQTPPPAPAPVEDDDDD